MTRLPRRIAAGLIIIALVMLGTVTIAVTYWPSSDHFRGAELVDPRDPRLSLTVDAERKHRAAQITSTFENSTLELQYDYVENIGDGRGITAGRAGFTSATGDLLLVVRRYSEAKPDNVLAPYISALQAVNGTDSTKGLGGFADAWAEAAEDPDFQKLQDELVDELYFDPAMMMAADRGIETRARAKSSGKRLTCSDAGVQGLRSGADSGRRVERPAARSLWPGQESSAHHAGGGRSGG